MQSRRVCVLGGGQLGRMLAEAANRLLIPLSILDASPHAPAKQLLAHQPHMDDHYASHDAIIQLATTHHPCIITTEIEHVDTAALSTIESTFDDVQVLPPSRVISIIQDKYRQKEFLRFHALPVMDYCTCENEASLQAAAEEFGFPLVLKTRKLAYDGRGNAVVHSPDDLATAFEALAGHAVDAKDNDTIYAERFAHFTHELAVMVVKSVHGPCEAYPVVETVQRNNICHLVLAPARVDAHILQEATRVAMAAVDALDGAGVYGVEMFALADGSVVINEIAPRPHNTGHYTIEACYTSQFENHLRAITGMSIGDTGMKVPAALMVNLLGSPTFDAAVKACVDFKGATLHLYGKEQRPGRKLGHVTCVGKSVQDVLKQVTPWLDGMVGAQDVKMHAVHKQLLQSYAPSPLVGIVMGSDSDLPVMRGAATILEQFNVPFELTIVSAHRTPARLAQYAASAQERGLRIIIAGAGGAAHLPGMLACQTPLPIIGVPVKGKVLDGVDSLHSIVQMPRGIPVATVAINGAENAGLLAVRMLGVGDASRLDDMTHYMQEMEQQVMAKVDKLAHVGWKDYI